MAKIIKPPAPIEFDARLPSVFLAGSIEMGQAEDWQARMESALDDLDIVVLNPRREAWDSSWVQSIHDARFRGQVEWELSALEQASLVAMYFAPTTKAPITLLELGLRAKRGDVIVCCPDGYWRKGNIEIVCQRHGIELVPSLQELIERVRRRLAS